MMDSDPEDTGPPLDQLLESLGAKSWRTRQLAIDQLAGQTSEESIRRVLEVFRQNYRDLSRLNAAIQVLEVTQAPVGPALLALLQDQDADLRCYAALTLGERRDLRTVPGLIAAVSDSQTNVRVHAIEALGKLRAGAAVDVLIEVAESLDFDVAFPAIDALREIGDGRVAARLVPLLQQPFLQATTIEALGALGDVEIIPTLLPFLGHPTVPIVTVVQAICRIHDRLADLYGCGPAVEEQIRQASQPDWTRIVTSAIKSASVSEAASLISFLSWLPGDEAGDCLVERLDDPQWLGLCIEALEKRVKSPMPRLLQRLERLGVQSEPAFIALIGRLGDVQAVPALLRLLESVDDEIVTAAIEALRRIDVASLYDRATFILGHPSAEVREAAVIALHSRVHSADLQKLLCAPSPLVRDSSVKIIPSKVPRDCFHLLFECCADSDERVQRAAIEHLPGIDDERVTSYLTQALRSENPQVRAAAASALGEITGPQVPQSLHNALADGDVWVRYFAIRSLARVDLGREYFETLRSADTSDLDIQVRIAATEALGQYGEQGLSLLIGLIANSNTDLARAAISALGTIGSPGSMSGLLSASKSEDRDVQIAAIRALAVSGQPNAVTAIVELAMSSDSLLAEESIKALGQIRSAASLDALFEIAAWPKKREAAAAALNQIAPGQTRQLASRLPTLSLDVRRFAIEVVSRVRSQEAMDVLEAALDDPEPAVRHSAFCALTHFRRADRPVPGTADAEGAR